MVLVFFFLPLARQDRAAFSLLNFGFRNFCSPFQTLPWPDFASLQLARVAQQGQLQHICRVLRVACLPLRQGRAGSRKDRAGTADASLDGGPPAMQGDGARFPQAAAWRLLPLAGWEKNG